MSQTAEPVYVNALNKIDELTNKLESDEKTGVKIVLKVLEEPIRQIASNALFVGSVIIKEIKDNGKATFGFDAYTEEFTDMFEAGIVDPAKVVRIAFQNAASIAAMVLTTESLVADIPEKPMQCHR